MTFPRLLSLVSAVHFVGVVGAAVGAFLALPGCKRSGGGAGTSPSGAPSSSAASSAPGSASAAPPASATAPAAATAVPLDPPPGAPSSPATFVGARTEKGCHAQTVELAGYQTRGDIALAGQGDTVAAAWKVRIAGKTEEQIGFGSFDKEGKPVARARGVGSTAQQAAPRVFGAGPSSFAVVWFDDKGLAYTRPRLEPLPPPDVGHVGAVGPEVAGEVALTQWPPGGALASAPFGADKAQLGVFLFAPADPAGPAVKAMGVTHHGKAPHRPALAAGPKGIFVAWDEGGALVASRFDEAGKDTPSACAVAPAGPKRDRVALAATATGAIALWMEGDTVRTRALDSSACPTSPIWTAAEGRWASITPFGQTALVVWATKDGHLLAARLAANGAPPEKGLDAAEGSAGIKDPPGVAAFGDHAAFAWAEAMSPIISTKRLVLRIVDAACVP